MEFATLSNGVKMPMEGFGVFQVQEGDVCKQAVLDAVAVGYRLIDTAAAYFNEEAVGAAIKSCGVSSVASSSSRSPCIKAASRKISTSGISN